MQESAGFVVELTADYPPAEALSRLLDLREHDRIIPLTRVTPAVPANELRAGSTFVARTAVGPLGFDDPMLVERISFEPAAARIVKQGRALRGGIDVRVVPSAAGSTVRWEQTVHLPWLPGILQPVAARVLRVGYRRVLGRLLGG